MSAPIPPFRPFPTSFATPQDRMHKATTDLMAAFLADHLLYIADYDPSNPDAGQQYAGMPDEQRYELRNAYVMAAMGAAASIGIPVTFQTDTSVQIEGADTIVATIKLPTGDVSWHLPLTSEPWDGHTTTEKYRRVHAFAERFF